MSMLNPHRSDAGKPTLRQRAEALKETAARVMRRQPTNQPSRETLLGDHPVRQAAADFPAADAASHDGVRGYTDDLGRDHAPGGQVPRPEITMGRHETFDQSTSLAADLLSGTAFLRAPVRELPEPGSEEAKAMWLEAVSEASRLMNDAVQGYPELQRSERGIWTKRDLWEALEAGEVSAAEYVRLQPVAAEREHRIDAASIATNANALQVLAYPNDFVRSAVTEEATSEFEQGDTTPSRPPVPDFSKLSINDLRRVFDALSVADHAYSHMTHFVDENGGGGALLDREGDRTGYLRGYIADELEERHPSNAHEAAARSDTLASWAIACGCYAEAATVCAAADAWRP